MESFSFKKKERLLKRAEFINLNLHGVRYYTKDFIVILKQNKSYITRLGITVSKRFGNSVKRNRIKRLIREFFRLNKQHVPKGYDIMVIALKEGGNVNLLKVKEELGGLLLKNDGLFS